MPHLFSTALTVPIDPPSPPLFITFEGGEGAGKSTQVKLLSSFLSSQNIPHTVTREPGGTENAEAIRAFLLEAPKAIDPVSEAFLMAAARREHLVHHIWPALREGKWVLCDRFYDSTMAYQGVGHALGENFINTLNHLTMGDFKPHLTFVLRLPFQEGLVRKQGSEHVNRFEDLDPSFHERVEGAFEDLCHQNPERCVAIDAARSLEDVRTAIQQHLLSFLSRR